MTQAGSPERDAAAMTFEANLTDYLGYDWAHIPERLRAPLKIDHAEAVALGEELVRLRSDRDRLAEKLGALELRVSDQRDIIQAISQEKLVIAGELFQLRGAARSPIREESTNA